jgi:acetyl-CoA C-acetyltransferase
MVVSSQSDSGIPKPDLFISNMKKVFIVSAARTPFGSFLGELSSLSATQLGAIVVKDAVKRAGIIPEDVEELIMGNVVSANLGQAPARQAAINGGLKAETICTTVNKVCASGMKAIAFAAESIMLGYNNIVVAGGMESMSNAPYYIEKARKGYKYGDAKLIDGVLKDGLWDTFNQFEMGEAGEQTSAEYNISREEQDAYAIESFRRAIHANKEGLLKEEIVPVEVIDKSKKTITITEDEQYKKADFEKIPKLKPVFRKDGTITAANASPLSDGASALVLMSEEKMKSMNVKPIARILSFADAAQLPQRFTTSPSLAIPKALERAGLRSEDVDYYEINEAFAVVSIINNRLLNLDPSRVNIYGGAISMGHPLGASGAKIVTTLISALRQKKGKTGVAGICNGGGGASAMVISVSDLPSF